MADQADASDQHDDITPEHRERLETAVSRNATALKEGELHKMGAGWAHGWKKRWFTLNSDSLVYFDKKGGNVKGGIMLESVTAVRTASHAETKKPHAFVVDTNADRTYVIHGASDGERDAWLQEINKIWAAYRAERGQDGVPAAAPAPAASPVLVLGASGQVGSGTVAALSAKGVITRAAVRNANSESAAKLAKLPGVTVVAADMGKSDTLAAAFDGVTAAFVVTPGAENRADLVAAAVDAAKAARTPHIVVITLPCVEAAGDILFKTQFGKIEAATRESGVPYTFLKLPMFIDNQWGSKATIKEYGKIFGPVDPAKPVSLISAADIAASAAEVLEAPDTHVGKTYTLAAEAVTFADIAATFAEALGKAVEYQRVPYAAAEEAMVGMGIPKWQAGGICELLELVDKEDVSVFDTKETEALLGRKPQTFKEWVAAVAPAFADTPPLKVLYWPTHGRAGAALRMLNEAKIPYERVTDVPGMAGIAGAFGADSKTFAPPIIIDGDVVVAQSIAIAMYVGKKAGFADGVDESVAVQYMLDIIDTFEGLYQAASAPAKLWTHLFGSGDGPARFHKLASNIERQISGPFYFGEKPSYVDFFLAATRDNLHAYALSKVNEVTGSDVLAKFPKIESVVANVRGLPNQKDYSDLLAFQAEKYGLKPEFVANFKAAGNPAGPIPDGFRAFLPSQAKGGAKVDAGTTAVVFIEFQNEFTTEGGKLHDAVKGVMGETDMLTKAPAVAEAARKAGAKVFHAGIYFKEDASDNPNGGLGILNGCKDGQLFTEGTWNSEFHESMKPQDSDVVVRGKRGLDAFPGSNLEDLLKEHGIATVALCGFLTNCCVESTMRTAYEKGFNVVTLTDVCACTSSEGHKAAAGEGGTFSMFSKQMTADEFQTALA